MAVSSSVRLAFRPAAVLHDRASALSDGEFVALMAPLGPWGAGRRVAVAVSGGADSLCLAWMLARWGRPLALVVDHGLRAGSKTETVDAAAALARIGVNARILTLSGLAVGPGMQARARVARFAALERACEAEGLPDLLLGHHASDQAETLLLRLEDKSGPDGLAGMAAVAETRHVRRVRPLLGTPQGRLRATLVQAGLRWSEDPSNANPAFSRVRWRQVLRQAPGSGEVACRLLPGGMPASLVADPGEIVPGGESPVIDRAPSVSHEPEPADAPLPQWMHPPIVWPAGRTIDLFRECYRHGEMRAEAEQARAVFLARHAAIRPEGFAVLDAVDFPPAALGALVRALSGAAYAPGAARLAALAPAAALGTIGGMRLMQAGRLGRGRLLVREAEALRPPVALKQGAVWDRRFAVCPPVLGPVPATEADAEPAPESIADAALGALGSDAARFRSLSTLPAAVLATLPAIRRGGAVIAVPHLGIGREWTKPLFRLRLTVPSPAAGAAFLPMRERPG